MILVAPISQEKELIVVTGSTGRIGSRLISHLSDAYRIVALYFPENPAPQDRDLADYKCVDLTESSQLERAFQEINRDYGDKIASVIHLAAYYSFKEVGFTPYQQINVDATESLLLALQSFKVEQFIFTSTLLVHKPGPEPIDEESALEPAWAYPQSKALAERAIQENHGSIPYLILRLAGCYDETANCPPLTQHIRRIYEMQPESIIFPGSRQNQVPYFHLEDLIHLIEAGIAKREALPSEQTLLAAEEEGISYEELHAQIGSLLHGYWPMVWVPPLLAKIGLAALNRLGLMQDNFIQGWMIDHADDNYSLSTNQAQQMLDWHPQHRIHEELPAIINNLLDDPDRWYAQNGLSNL